MYRSLYHPHTPPKQEVQLGPPVNIFDLYRDMNQKKMKKLTGYDGVLQKCYQRIKIAARVDQMKMFYEVPEFVLGLPIYDIHHCMAYMMHQLRQHGFIVTYYFPRILYISWDPVDLPAHTKAKAKHILAPPYEPALTQNTEDIQFGLPHTLPAPSSRSSLIEQDTYTRENKPLQLSTNYRIPRMKAPPEKKNSIPEYMTSYKPSGKFVLDLT